MVIVNILHKGCLFLFGSIHNWIAPYKTSISQYRRKKIGYTYSKPIQAKNDNTTIYKFDMNIEHRAIYLAHVWYIFYWNCCFACRSIIKLHRSSLAGNNKQPFLLKWQISLSLAYSLDGIVYLFIYLWFSVISENICTHPTNKTIYRTLCSSAFDAVHGGGFIC